MTKCLGHETLKFLLFTGIMMTTTSPPRTTTTAATTMTTALIHGDTANIFIAIVIIIAAIVIAVVIRIVFKPSTVIGEDEEPSPRTISGGLDSGGARELGHAPGSSSLPPPHARVPNCNTDHHSSVVITGVLPPTTLRAFEVLHVRLLPYSDGPPPSYDQVLREMEEERRIIRSGGGLDAVTVEE